MNVGNLASLELSFAKMIASCVINSLSVFAWLAPDMTEALD